MNLVEVLQPVSRTTLVDDIFEQVLSLIASGKLVPNEKLPPERELANKLGVGRASVREALRALTAIGVLDARPGEGTFVTESPIGSFLSPFILDEPVTRENARELVEARLFLEVKIVSLVIERGGEAEKDLIRRCFDDMVSKRDHPEDFYLADWCFHEAIAQAAHNSYLLRTLLMYRYLIRKWFTQRADKYIDSILQEHKAILDAIQIGDAEAAQRAVRRHLEDAAKRVMDAIQM